MKLTLRQSRFVDEYFQTGNGTQAAIKAGYANDPNSAAVQSYRLLRNAKVIAEITRKKAEIEQINGIDQTQCAKMYQEIYDDAMQKHKFRQAIKAVDCLCLLFGLIEKCRGKRKR